MPRSLSARRTARRLAADDCRGIAGPAGNLTGLHDARDFFRTRT